MSQLGRPALRSSADSSILDPLWSMPDAASSPIEARVIDVLKNVSRRPIEPSLSSDLVTDLGFDSLQVLEVVSELEDQFDIAIPMNDVPSARTVSQVVAQVAALVEERSRM
jgi:acyl carrier protein